jgi:hypothetical protein
MGFNSSPIHRRSPSTPGRESQFWFLPRDSNVRLTAWTPAPLQLVVDPKSLREKLKAASIPMVLCAKCLLRNFLSPYFVLSVAAPSWVFPAVIEL